MATLKSSREDQRDDTVETINGVFVFGITGATCSGKSAVTNYLCDTQQHTLVIHQDDYYHPDHLIPRTQCGTYTNWDSIGAIDTSKLLETVKSTMKFPQKNCKDCTDPSIESDATNLPSTSVIHTVLVEGTMILDVKELVDLLHAAFFITLDYETCKQRRDGRTYPSDVGAYLDPPGYFEGIVWPEYLRTMKVVSSIASKDDTVCLLDGGSKTLSELQTNVEDAISERMSILRTI